MRIAHGSSLVIISGGQTGVDRAALDVAMELGLEHGGWCPKGRLAEDGAIPERYRLKESRTADYSDRTELNVKKSDGTLVLGFGAPEPGSGTAFTVVCARKLRKPCLVIDLKQADVAAARAWLHEHAIARLNVAGPRESGQPGGHAAAAAFLRQVLAENDTRRAMSNES